MSAPAARACRDGCSCTQFVANAHAPHMCASCTHLAAEHGRRGSSSNNVPNTNQRKCNHPSCRCTMFSVHPHVANMCGTCQHAVMDHMLISAPPTFPPTRHESSSFAPTTSTPPTGPSTAAAASSPAHTPVPPAPSSSFFKSSTAAAVKEPSTSSSFVFPTGGFSTNTTAPAAAPPPAPAKKLEEPRDAAASLPVPIKFLVELVSVDERCWVNHQPYLQELGQCLTGPDAEKHRELWNKFCTAHYSLFKLQQRSAELARMSEPQRAGVLQARENASLRIAERATAAKAVSILAPYVDSVAPDKSPQLVTFMRMLHPLFTGWLRVLDAVSWAAVMPPIEAYADFQREIDLSPDDVASLTPETRQRLVSASANINSILCDYIGRLVGLDQVLRTRLAELKVLDTDEFSQAWSAVKMLPQAPSVLILVNFLLSEVAPLEPHRNILVAMIKLWTARLEDLRKKPVDSILFGLLEVRLTRAVADRCRAAEMQLKLQYEISLQDIYCPDKPKSPELARRLEEQSALVEKLRETESALSRQLQDFGGQSTQGAQVALSYRLRATGLLIPNRRLSDYRIVKVLGHNSMSVHGTFHAFKIMQVSRGGVDTVLKQMPVVTPQDMEFVEKEILNRGEIDSPFVLPILGFFTDISRDGTPCVIVESPYYSRGNLSDWLVAEARRPWHIQSMFFQLLIALKFIHSIGIVHRSLKAEAVLVGPGGQDKATLTDFEFSTRMSQRSRGAGVAKEPFVLQRETTIGAPVALVTRGGLKIPPAPEIESGGKAGPATDMWNFGVLLYHAHFVAPLATRADGGLEIPPHSNERLRLLLSALLRFDPLSRLSANQAVAHPYFTVSFADELERSFSRSVIPTEEKLTMIRDQIANMRTTRYFWRVTRSTLIEDVHEVIKTWRGEDLLQTPFVTFDSEPAIDSGGVQADFFSTYFEMLCSNQAGLLSCAQGAAIPPSGQTYLPRTSAPSDTLACVGAMMAYALIHGHPLPMSLAPPLLKYILDVEPVATLQDLACYDYTEYQSLRDILTMANAASLELTFEEVRQTRPNELVTDDNKQEFADLRAHFRLVGSRQAQLEAVKRGFCSVPGLRALLPRLDVSDLELLLCGQQRIDAEAIISNLMFPENEARPITSWLSSFIREADQERLRCFLFFVTANFKVPFGGWPRKFQINITPESQLLPIAHTCFWTVDLPAYSSRTILDNKLVMALENVVRAGFGYG
eukprot:gnl/Spiro4/13235_TR7022_c0_g1_i1.p1 gnl/Spiro4/13235_TR7022_c0_g1~~gnl/Spiro4/13235_TR7022_c0_g1_i1.p1  ORF type:complete len:1217 (+),score=232.49 gnl/Spiro4/13235_TR7022_c0_g1_i1:99-3749(+)